MGKCLGRGLTPGKSGETAKQTLWGPHEKIEKKQVGTGEKPYKPINPLLKNCI